MRNRAAGHRFQIDPRSGTRYGGRPTAESIRRRPV